MYWTGDTPWLAAGTGAASFLAGYRHSRPKSLKKYYDYVDTLQRD
jgi:coproporphyrinogen III oxidase-like Fe-S oxidoreductase